MSSEVGSDSGGKLKPKGRWARVSNKAHTQAVENVKNSLGSKGKFASKGSANEVLTQQEQKIKLDEDTKQLSSLLASQLGLAEAVDQFCQVQ